MAYKNLRAAVTDLEKSGQLKRISIEVDPNLEMAEIHRRVFEARGPAILFERVKGSPFQALSNMYGTFERTDFLFRHTIKQVEKVIRLKLDPSEFIKKPLQYASAPFTALKSLPMRIPLGMNQAAKFKTKIDQLPQVKSWPDDVGAFVTLPQVYTEDPEKRGIMGSNIGMYRVQLSGNDYKMNEQVGMHYQIHRGIGVHHTKYNRLDAPFLCSVIVGGPPSFALSAIFPLPEGLPEALFAGMLNGRRYRYSYDANGNCIPSEADFVITGIIEKNKKMPEGPFGDHLGYYSLQHDFPVMRVLNVYHRKNPIWQFTAVGRPPAEDSSFGYMIHNIVKPLTPQEFPGLIEINAVDASGVHPLLLAIGKERYMPFREQKPEEILTIANRILGSGQTSLAKFLFICDDEGYRNTKLSTDATSCVSTKNYVAYFKYILERIDLARDIHFQTRTTIDTLDYSGTGWNEGSKVVFAACGKILRTLATEIPTNFTTPSRFTTIKMVMPGIVCISAPTWQSENSRSDIHLLALHLKQFDLTQIPFIVIVDDAEFTAQTINNFLWVTFTRANPSHDIYGVNERTVFKHWQCDAVIIDSRKKPHHAPELVADKKVSEKVDKLFAKGGVLEKING